VEQSPSVHAISHNRLAVQAKIEVSVLRTTRPICHLTADINIRVTLLTSYFYIYFNIVHFRHFVTFVMPGRSGLLMGWALNTFLDIGYCEKRDQIPDFILTISSVHILSTVTPGNKVAENGNKLLPKTATLTGAATMLPFRATICCRLRQQFVAWFGQALR